MSAADQQSTAVGKERKWECKTCGKIFQTEYILNYHKLLEHSQYKRPPVGVG
jgi:tRNA(Ile2) C34 agmatinyltransferase TiaS